MATYSNILACGIPWTEEAGGLKSMRSQRVRQVLVTEKQNKKLSVRYQLTDKEKHTARSNIDRNGVPRKE